MIFPDEAPAKRCLVVLDLLDDQRRPAGRNRRVRTQLASLKPKAIKTRHSSDQSNYIQIDGR